MNKNRLFRELIKLNLTKIISVKHIQSGEVATGPINELMYQFVVDMESLFSDMFDGQTYEIRFLSDEEVAKIINEWEEEENRLMMEECMKNV
ncbi:MAG: hypothetical protein WC934_13610 [Acidithiobacillus sp.]|jgi:ferredoxin-fold anticodon binding domain-containing protein|uniref:hypothetical protein n=1 Tax=Acidithiobacillus sp. TaxID=1872118 RepID=UPI00355D73FA